MNSIEITSAGSLKWALKTDPMFWNILWKEAKYPTKLEEDRFYTRTAYDRMHMHDKDDETCEEEGMADLNLKSTEFYVRKQRTRLEVLYLLAETYRMVKTRAAGRARGRGTSVIPCLHHYQENQHQHDH